MTEDDIPFVAYGNDELEKMQAVDDTVTCPHCTEQHTVEYGTTEDSDGVCRPSKILGFYNCPETLKSYLCSIHGKLLI